MGIRHWLELRAVELLASTCAASLLIGGLAAGFPFLRERIAEVFLYSLCCISAVLLHAAIDLALRAIGLLARVLLMPAALDPAPATLEPATA